MRLINISIPQPQRPSRANSTPTLAFMTIWVLRNGKDVLMKEWLLTAFTQARKVPLGEESMALVCCRQWYLRQGAEGKSSNNMKYRDGGYFQVSWLPSFHDAGVLCCWNPNSSLVAYTPALGNPAISDNWKPNRASLTPYFRDFFPPGNVEYSLWKW